MSLMSRLLTVIRARLSVPCGEEAPFASGSADRGYKSDGPTARKSPNVDPLLAEYYANLEAPYASDLATVRRAWKRLLRKYHPDLHCSDPARQKIATELVKKLNHAYEQLRERLEEA